MDGQDRTRRDRAAQSLVRLRYRAPTPEVGGPQHARHETWISFVMVACIWHDMLAFAEYLLLAASGVFAYGLRTVIGARRGNG